MSSCWSECNTTRSPKQSKFNRYFSPLLFGDCRGLPIENCHFLFDLSGSIGSYLGYFGNNTWFWEQHVISRIFIDCNVKATLTSDILIAPCAPLLVDLRFTLLQNGCYGSWWYWNSQIRTLGERYWWSAAWEILSSSKLETELRYLTT